MKCLEYPFDSEYLLRKRKRIKKELLIENKTRIIKKVAILGGSTTNDIKLMLELFLLNYGIEPVFYESEYNQYYEECMFPNSELEEFKPDIIYIHTTNRNIVDWPKVMDTEEQVESKLQQIENKFVAMWERVAKIYKCPIIQNNFEYPYYRFLGNKDASDIRGWVHFVTALNERFYKYARSHENFYINDINYLSASYGLEKWANNFSWHMYKYCCDIDAIPDLSFSIAKIIKSLFGKNKKGFVLDLDNTLWGGIVGDDGVENILIGQEVSQGQAFDEFQKYIKYHKDMGIVLNVCSKNEHENAIAGIMHPDMVLKKDDFIKIKANWDPKDRNIVEIANELNLLPESFVFVDDNPAERNIVESQLPGIGVPDVGTDVVNFINIIDKSGFFEVTNFSDDDIKRNEMYQSNAKREELQMSFESYEDYLLSLNMNAHIKPFESVYMARIAQLTNKSNQFNLTTKRYTQTEIEEVSSNSEYISLYGKLEDKFGDNGVVSVVIGNIKEKELHIDLWIMSCRVLKRDMEFAMMDTLVKHCLEHNINTIKGFYYPTAKNAMVKEFYKLQGFEKIKEDDKGNTEWEFSVLDYEKKNHVIQVES